jgi:CubicO group peptidase (beta-lactamase class C family)
LKRYLNPRMVFRVLAAAAIAFALIMSAAKFNFVNNPEEGSSLEGFTSHLDSRIPALMEDYDIPGVCVALIKKGDIAWTKAYGYADLESGSKMTTDAYLRVQSISKPVTAWGVMKLVEQGKIELDAPIQQYIKNWSFPETGFSTGKITVRQLLSHCAGMPLGDVMDIYPPGAAVPSLQESLTKTARLTQEPGLSFSYSNVGYNLLELLIEEVTGLAYSEYMEQEVLTPLGMHQSTFIWTPELNPPVPLGHSLTGKPVSVYIYPEKASGGLFSSVEDIATFVSAGMPDFSREHPVLTPESINELYKPVANKLGVYSLVFDSYGLGYYIENLPDGKKAVSHGGQGTGWMTHFHGVPETGDGIVILTNSQRSWPFIAYVLSDWARWSGSSVGMSRIILGQNLLWSLIGVIWFALLVQIWRLTEGIVAGKRIFTVLSKKFHILRWVQISLFAVLIGSVWWCMNQDYLFVSSVFPVASNWLGVTAIALAMVLLLSALLPERNRL